MEKENIAREQYTFFESPEDRDIDEIFKERDAKKVAEEFVKTNMPEYKSLEWRVKKRRETKEAEQKSIKAPAIKKKNKKKKSKILSKGFAIGALSTVLLIGGIKVTKEAVDRIDYNLTVKEAVNAARDAAEEKLIENGLATRNNEGDFIIGDNSTFDYAKLDLGEASPAVIRAYEEAISNKEEFTDFIRAVSYENGLYNYTGIEQYYTVNGYIDPRTGAPSHAVYTTYTNNDLVNALNEGQITALVNGETNQTQGRGH